MRAERLIKVLSLSFLFSALLAPCSISFWQIYQNDGRLFPIMIEEAGRFGNIALGLVVFLFCLSPLIGIAFGLWQQERWGRGFALVFAISTVLPAWLMVFTIGGHFSDDGAGLFVLLPLFVGIWDLLALAILFRRDVRALFNESPTTLHLS